MPRVVWILGVGGCLAAGLAVLLLLQRDAQHSRDASNWVLASAPAAAPPVAAPTGSRAPSKRPSEITPLADEWGERSFACEVADDCVLTDLRDGKCCPALCSLGTVVNRAFENALVAQRASAGCDGRACPQPRCEAPCKSITPVCTHGRCEAQEHARPCSP